MEREIVSTNRQFKGVTFTNFPGYKDPESGEITFKLLDGVMCEDIATQIPSRIRSCVIVDFSALDYAALLAETKGKHGIERTMTDAEMRAAEEVLIAAIFDGDQSE
ncbi:hypothetical protein [Alicyclobacillus sp. ALC3]|uniref:hypothetical protein n=1 Tax=Alicyclobacillus sp. ALC3 TaxID=2796143 RepID=UPI0023796890|nr:hypothetical protein [Alicyclobacillus sp. ALC3]WDL99731.1 hypothetical protein JC200_24175 [Alicyclobacillus sp. ALC3]